MAYFKYLPKVYVRQKSRINGVQPYELAVNIFRRIKIRDSLQGALLGFIQYEITEGQRPDQIAYEYYNDPGLDWIVLLVNNIINVNEDWPLTRDDLREYVSNKYGSIEGIKHYETNEYIDPATGMRLMPEGLIVPEDFHITKANGDIVPKSVSRSPVSYFNYESKINETKRNIYLLRPLYITDFISEFKRLCDYLPHAEVDPEGNKKTEGSLAEEFIGLPRYSKPRQSTASTGSASGGGSSTALLAGSASVAGTAAEVSFTSGSGTTITATLPSSSTSSSSTSSSSSSSSSSVPVPAAVDLAVLQVLQVPQDRLDLVVHLDPQDLAVLVAEDTTAADTRNTKVLSYRNSKERRVRCAC